MPRRERKNLGADVSFDAELPKQLEVLSARPPISPAQPKRFLDQHDQPLQGGSRWVEVPRARVGVLEHDRAVGASQPHIGLHLPLGAPERADLIASVDEVERVQLELAGKEIVLDQTYVSQTLLVHEPASGCEHRLVDVGAGHLTVGPDPLAQDTDPAEHATTYIQGVGTATIADLFEQPPAAGLPNPRLKLEPLQL